MEALLAAAPEVGAAAVPSKTAANRLTSLLRETGWLIYSLQEFSLI